MKRRISILLLLVLSAGFLLPWAWAEEPEDVVLMSDGTIPAFVVVSDGEGVKGGEATVPISLNRTTFSNLSLQLVFDTDALTLKSVEMKDLGCRLMEKSPDGTAMIWSADGNVTWEGGVIAALTFSILPDAPAGKSEVTVTHYTGRSDLDEPYVPGRDCNYQLNGVNNRVALTLIPKSGFITVTEPPCTVAAADKGGGTFQVSMAGPSTLDGKLAAAWYDANGQMKQVRLLAPKDSQEVSFPRAAKGDWVRFMWVTDQYVPRCQAVGKTVT